MGSTHLDFGLDVVDGVAALHLEGDGLPRQGLHEDLHLLLASSSLAQGRSGDLTARRRTRTELRENETEERPRNSFFLLLLGFYSGWADL
jgi:hypothetical protein